MLIDQLQFLCQRLNGQGWGTLLQDVAGLKINQTNARDLAQELSRELVVDREAAGFEDFNPVGKQGITPGNPSASLLYHALASPGVQRSTLTYPTLADLDLVENYIFAQARVSLASLRLRAQTHRLGVVTYAYDYRPAVDTVQGAYADWVLSRTGVQRVGNTAPAYVPALRSFTPWQEGDDRAAVRVLPARYAAFLAVQVTGRTTDLGVFGPLDSDLIEQILSRKKLLELLPTPHGRAFSDETLEFWVPLHKLFPGTECLLDFSVNDGLHVNFEVQHRNLKLQRQWSQLAGMGYALDLTEHDINAPPFIRADHLADRSQTPTDGPCLVVPEPHAAFNAQVNLPNSNDPLPFPVMEDYDQFIKDYTGDDNAYGWFWTSFYLPQEPNGAHRGPEYVNVRGELTPGGVRDLNTQPDLANYLNENAFEAQTWEDYSADGWVAPLVPELGGEIDPTDVVAAYSLVTAPAFFPYVRQRDLMAWSVERFAHPTADWAKVWNVLPVALCHDRVAPNVELRGSQFSIRDLTATAIVCLPAPERPPLQAGSGVGLRRTSFLPDAAAGTYAPGWETSYDRRPNGAPFLAAYGLGSPFAEDAMICSALGTFWPGPAPDTSRLFASVAYRTEAPLTDTEVGLPNVGTSWDSIPAPIFCNDGEHILFMNKDYVDYTRNAVLRVQPFMDVDVNDYTARVLSMYNALAAVGVNPNRLPTLGFRAEATEWRVLLFRKSSPEDVDFQNALRAVNRVRAAGPVYLLRLAQIEIVDDPLTRNQLGAGFNQTLGRLKPGQDYTLYTFATGTLRSATGLPNWELIQPPR